MKRVNYNIEFAHFYADELFGEEQIESIQVTQKLIKELKSQGKTFVTCVLIHQFHPAAFQVNEEKLRKVFEEHGLVPDFFVYEGKLNSVSDEIIEEIPSSILNWETFQSFKGPHKRALMLKKAEYGIGLKEEIGFTERHTCAMLIAAWDLCRLGAYKIPEESIRRLNDKTFESEKIISIIPTKYNEVENKSLQIIKATKFKDLSDKIEQKFF